MHLCRPPGKPMAQVVLTDSRVVRRATEHQLVTKVLACVTRSVPREKGRQLQQ